MIKRTLSKCENEDVVFDHICTYAVEKSVEDETGDGKLYTLFKCVLSPGFYCPCYIIPDEEGRETFTSMLLNIGG